jgi:hypothetical protein
LACVSPECSRSGTVVDTHRRAASERHPLADDHARRNGVLRMGFFPFWANPTRDGRPENEGIADGCAPSDIIMLGVKLTELLLAEWQVIHPAFGHDLYQVFDPERAIARRSAWGGTAPDAVREQLALARQVVSGP